jgi:lysophospholipase L1-like esterase
MMNARKKSHRTYRIRVYVLFVAFSIILPLLLIILAEGFASVIKAVRAGGWRSAVERKHTKVDDVLGWVNQQSIDVPDLYGPGLGLSTNSRRFRGRRETDDRIPAGKIRIVCSGDSYTLGYGVSDAHTYPQQLESLDPRLEVVNMGQSGYGVDQAYLLYERDATFEHNIQIFAFITDDLYRMTMPQFFGYPKPLLKVEAGVPKPANTPLPNVEKSPPSKMGLVNNLRLTQIVSAALRKTRASADGILTEAQWQLFEAILTELGKLNKRRHSVLCVVYLPEDSNDYFKNRLDRPRERVRKFCERHGFLFIDIVERWQQLPSVENAAEMMLTRNGSEGHYNVAGNSFVATIIYRQLIESGLLPGLATKQTEHE